MSELTRPQQVPLESDPAVLWALQSLQRTLCGPDFAGDSIAEADSAVCSVPQGTNGWVVSVRGMRRLTQAVALRERFASMPGCLTSQVASLSSQEIRLALTTSRTVPAEWLSFVIAEAVRSGDAHDFDVIPRSPRVAG